MAELPRFRMLRRGWRNVTFAYRAAEFLTAASDPQKLGLCERFIALLDAAFTNDGIDRHVVPYPDGGLPALRLAPAGSTRGTVVVHGGFDSLIEEFVAIYLHLAAAGMRSSPPLEPLNCVQPFEAV